jgi:dTDP-glucose 4,6-dehydratase
VGRVLILGGAGFIGSHLCDRFLARGDVVIALDNLVTGHRRNIAHLAGHERFEFIEADITERLDEGLVPGPISAILNFASPASPKDFETLPLEILAVGSTGHRNALELARSKGARILFASTSEVYGDPLVNPQPESYLGNVSCTGIRSCYDESKRFGEALSMAYHRKYGLQTRIVRIFNTYGPRMAPEDGRALPNFINQALRGEPVTIYGDGQQTRSFGYVSDLCAGIEKLLDSDCTSPVNIGNPDEITILQVAKEVIALTGSKSVLINKPMPPSDPKLRQPDIRKAREVLGWQPKVDRATGLRKTIDYFAELASSEASS